VSLQRIHFVAVAALAVALPLHASEPIDLSTARVVDLSHGFDETTIYWPTSPTTFHLEQLQYGPTPGGWFYSANAFSAPEHGGTHMDAPIHFFAGRRTVDEIPARQLVAPLVVVDLRERAATDPDTVLRRADLAAWEEAHGRIPEGAFVALWTGWSDRWPDRKAYLGDDSPGDASKLHFPSFGPEAVRWLLSERKVSAIGLDTASIDPGNSSDFPVHQLVGEANVPGLENLARLGEVPATGAWIVALPMKIVGGSGAPARVVALVP